MRSALELGLGDGLSCDVTGVCVCVRACWRAVDLSDLPGCGCSSLRWIQEALGRRMAEGKKVAAGASGGVCKCVHAAL